MGVRGGKCEFFTLEGKGRAMSGVSPTKSWVQTKVLKHLLEFWVFFKKYPYLVGVKGAKVDFCTL